MKNAVLPNSIKGNSLVSKYEWPDSSGFFIKNDFYTITIR